MPDPRRYMQVYESLKQQISDGTIAPGTRLYMDRIADEFAVSREPVQHALRLLGADGLVDYYDGLGWHVR